MSSSNVHRELHEAKNLWNASHAYGDELDEGGEEFLSRIECQEQRSHLTHDNQFRVLR